MYQSFCGVSHSFCGVSHTRDPTQERDPGRQERKKCDRERNKDKSLPQTSLCRKQVFAANKSLPQTMKCRKQRHATNKVIRETQTFDKQKNVCVTGERASYQVWTADSQEDGIYTLLRAANRPEFGQFVQHRGLPACLLPASSLWM